MFIGELVLIEDLLLEVRSEYASDVEGIKGSRTLFPLSEIILNCNKSKERRDNDKISRLNIRIKLCKVESLTQG